MLPEESFARIQYSLKTRISNFKYNSKMVANFDKRSGAIIFLI